MIDSKSNLITSFLVVLLVMALVIYLVLDQIAAASLYLPFTLFYTVFWVAVGKILLREMSRTQQLSALAFFLTAILIIYQTNWDSRKQFLQDFRQIEPGMTTQQVDRKMQAYVRIVPTATQLNLQGEVVAGTVSFRHTTQGWGDADIGMVVIDDGRVVTTNFYPD